MHLVCPNGHSPQVPGPDLQCCQCGARLVAGTGMPHHATAQQDPSLGGGFGEFMLPGGSAALASVPPPSPAPGPPSPAPPAPPAPPAASGGAAAAASCETCGEGARLAAELDVCPRCRRLRPLAGGYSLDAAFFQWAQDGAAMARLRSIGPLNAAARTVSDKIGRRWVEAAFNGVRVSEVQLPAVHAHAVRAARLLGLTHLPEVYVSGDRVWDAGTYGTDQNAAIVIGTALLNSFRGDELMFILGREMGHCRVGHALWKTVGAFLLGEQGVRRGAMSGGVLSMLNPTTLVEGAVETPLLAWARQAEITADRAGLLAVGDEEIARRVLLSWSLRSVVLYRQINIQAWLEQQEDSDDGFTRLSELLSSPTPYITRRLKLLSQYVKEPPFVQARDWLRQVAPAPKSPAPGGQSAGLVAGSSPAAPPPARPRTAPEGVRVSCPSCQATMRLPRAAFQGRDVVHTRCPNTGCGRTLALRAQPGS